MSHLTSFGSTFRPPTHSSHSFQPQNMIMVSTCVISRIFLSSVSQLLQVVYGGSVALRPSDPHRIRFAGSEHTTYWAARRQISLAKHIAAHANPCRRPPAVFPYESNPQFGSPCTPHICTQTLPIDAFAVRIGRRWFCRPWFTPWRSDLFIF